jgi:hypothetical protein
MWRSRQPGKRCDGMNRDQIRDIVTIIFLAVATLIMGGLITIGVLLELGEL